MTRFVIGSPTNNTASAFSADELAIMAATCADEREYDGGGSSMRRAKPKSVSLRWCREVMRRLLHLMSRCRIRRACR
jgi:hypothetical protein